MRKLVPIVALLVTPLHALASKEHGCNNAINKTAAYLQLQSAASNDTEQPKELSREKIEAMIGTSQNIVDEGERMIALCDLDREMTEGIINLIISNTTNIEQLIQHIDNRWQAKN